MISSEIRVLSLEDAVLWCQTWRRRNLKIGFTNGCFDVLHLGHLAVLDYTLGKCDRLVVGLNSDESVRRLKGKSRPVVPQHDRATMLAALTMVDAVTVFDEDTPMQLIRAIEPDVLIKGADYPISTIVGADFVRDRGGKIYRCPILPGRSTTATLRKIA